MTIKKTSKQAVFAMTVQGLLQVASDHYKKGYDLEQKRKGGCASEVLICAHVQHAMLKETLEYCAQNQDLINSIKIALIITHLLQAENYIKDLINCYKGDNDKSPINPLSEASSEVMAVWMACNSIYSDAPETDEKNAVQETTND